MRVTLLRARQYNSPIPLSAEVVIAVGGAAIVAIATVSIYMFRKGRRKTKLERALGQSIAMGSVPQGPAGTSSQFTGSHVQHRDEMSPSVYPPRQAPLPPPPPQAPDSVSPRDPEEARIWDEWLARTAPKPPNVVAQQPGNNRRPQLNTNRPWLETRSSALPDERSSRITDLSSEDMRSPIELELAQDAQLERAQSISHTRATSGPLSGPSALPTTPPRESRTSLHAPPPRMARALTSIRRKPLSRQSSVAEPPSGRQPAGATPSPSSSSSRPPSLPLPDFTVPTSPDELFIPPGTALGSILEPGNPGMSEQSDHYSPISPKVRDEDLPVLLARERVERLREERKRLEKIEKLRRLEEQARRELREAQRASLEAKRRSAEAQAAREAGAREGWR